MNTKLLTRHSLFIMLIGLTINILLVRLASFLSLPVYLDTIGTTLVAALGGSLPGITVGFLSNILTSIYSISTDPLTLYYGILNIFIAMVTAWFSRRGLLRRLYYAPLLIVCLSLIGGGLGAVMTWILYGFDFGSGVTAPIAIAMYEHGMSRGWAEFLASMAVDGLDKTITVCTLITVLKLMPQSIKNKLPLGEIYDWSKPYHYVPARRDKLAYRKRSIRTKLVSIIIITAAVFSATSIASSVVAFRRMLIEQYSERCESIAGVAALEVNGDEVDRYLESRSEDEGYKATKAKLEQILRNAPQITFLYVYKIEPDGCHVVFDLDTQDIAGENLGTVLPFDDSFTEYIPTLLSGGSIDPIITDDTYGWLLTAYQPILNTEGICVAYACADIDMNNINDIIGTFFTSIASLLFGAFVLLSCFALHYCDQMILEPIGTLVKHTHTAFTAESIDDRVETGDELEALYVSMRERDKRIGGYIDEISHKNDELSQMQRNIIYSLANMTESRDQNTGNHIKRTAAYVRIIARQMQLDGYQKHTITKEYIQQLYESAPLHDIGKIKISDTILNKPGKLTPDEFAIMKTHTTIGSDILRSSLEGISDIGSLGTAIEMVESHHEKWDGSGYPRGLAGDAIPFSARIMAVSDVFDALASKRSYKEAMPIDQAFQIVKEDSGKHFDPDVVTAFLKAEADIRRAALL